MDGNVGINELARADKCKDNLEVWCHSLSSFVIEYCHHSIIYADCNTYSILIARQRGGPQQSVPV